ncbi:phosphatase PAP2 family protein [Clostridium sp.]|uniref:phosphatase PAP2 family protein n=1 Tax=Clostridium sp. TaxID=1506 RepID=UPI00285187A8|nr:phosphatase PAP2 family protein [Clostridium sp.]MDR3598798.1 phosphatase PAP2 family protein [Clostridium sp.]
MNMEFFRLINNLANKNMILDKIMIFFSKDVPYIFMAVTAIVFIIGIKRKDSDCRKVAFNTFVITVINLILSFIIGNIYYVDRPFIHNKVNLLMPHTTDASFPSDHATGTMSIALGLAKYNKILTTILTLLSLIVGFSRVYVGNHYPMDVIGAYIMVIVTNYIYNFKLRSKVEKLYEIVEKKIATKLAFGLLNNEIN